MVYSLINRMNGLASMSPWEIYSTGKPPIEWENTDGFLYIFP